MRVTPPPKGAPGCARKLGADEAAGAADDVAIGVSEACCCPKRPPEGAAALLAPNKPPACAQTCSSCISIHAFLSAHTVQDHTGLILSARTINIPSIGDMLGQKQAVDLTCRSAGAKGRRAGAKRRCAAAPKQAAAAAAGSKCRRRAGSRSPKGRHTACLRRGSRPEAGEAARRSRRALPEGAAKGGRGLGAERGVGAPNAGVAAPKAGVAAEAWPKPAKPVAAAGCGAPNAGADCPKSGAGGEAA